MEPRTLRDLNALLDEFEEGVISNQELPATAKYLRGASLRWHDTVANETHDLAKFLMSAHAAGADVELRL